MKKKTNYSHCTGFRYDDKTDYQIEKLKELTKCKSTTKIIRKAIDHYYIWETISFESENIGGEHKC